MSPPRRELRTFAGHTDQVNGVAFSPDGQSILTGGQEGIALLWRVALPPAVAPFSGHTGAVGSVAFSPDGNYVLTGSEDNTARLWDAQTRAEVRQFAGHSRQSQCRVLARRQIRPDQQRRQRSPGCGIRKPGRP